MAATLNRRLGEEGHSTTVAYTATQGLRAAKRSGTDIVLLDLGIPVLDGVEMIGRVCREYVEKGRSIYEDSHSDLACGLKI